MERIVNHVLDRLGKVKNKTGTFQVFVGFDGYVDTLVKPVKTVAQNGQMTFFETIGEFGEYLQSKAHRSCSLELHKMDRKAGGNAAIFANAISTMGISTNCVGAFGYPKVQELFKNFGDHLDIRSVSEPGYCTALEFDDGKIMLAENEGINAMDYRVIEERIGHDNLYRMIDEADIIALMNWSEMPKCTDIWKGLQEHVFEALPKSSRKKIFVDISDCSRRSLEDIREMMSILREFSDYCEVTLSLNQNEFDRVYEAVSENKEIQDIEAAGRFIRQKSELKYLVLHQMEGAVVFTEKETSFIPNYKVEHPVISTGGGDNFNAGLVFGLMSGMDICATLYLANAVSSYYVSHGKSPKISEIIEYIYQCKEERKAVI